VNEEYTEREDKEVVATLEESTGDGDEQPLLTIEIEQTIEREPPEKADKTGKPEGGSKPAKKNMSHSPTKEGEKQDVPTAESDQPDQEDKAELEEDPNGEYKVEDYQEPQTDNEPEAPAEQPPQQPEQSGQHPKNYDDYEDMVADDEFSGENFNEGHPDKSHVNAGEDDDRPEHDQDENEFTRWSGDDEYQPLSARTRGDENEYHEDEDEDEDEESDDGRSWSEFGQGLLEHAARHSNHAAEVMRIKQEIDKIIQEMRDDPYKNEPVTVEWLARFWMTAWWNPITWGHCKKIDLAVQTALTGATAGWHYVLTIIKFKYPFNTVGGLLELLDGPIGGIGFGINVKDLLNLILGIPGIQHMLRFLRRLLYPILRCTALAYRKNLAQKHIDKLVAQLYQKYLR